jgi:hypothetical protein
MRLAQISNRAAELSEQYRVPEHLNNASRKVSEVSGKVYERASVAGEAARRGAIAAYRTALDHPKTSVGAIIVAAALVGGLLWWMFGDERQPVQRRRSHARVRSGSAEQRGKPRASRRAQAAAK